MRQVKQGFTLIEMLVVIAILALLAGIIYAATSSVREKGRQAVCISNLKQIYHALSIYRSDYEGVEPEGPRKFYELGLPPASAFGRYGNGGAFTVSYLKDPRLWICPNDSCVSFLRFNPECRSNPRQCCTSYTAAVYWEGCLPGVGCFPDVVDECRERFPLYFCRWHGFEQGVSSYALVLRLNGEVKGQVLRLPLTPCLD